MSVIEKEIEKYLSEIRNNLVCSGKLKKDIIEEIESSIYDYAECKGIKDISEVYIHFGTPEEMARTYLSQVDPKKIKKAVNVRKVVVLGVLFALIMLLVFYVAIFIDAHKAHSLIVEDEIINMNIVNNYIILFYKFQHIK